MASPPDIDQENQIQTNLLNRKLLSCVCIRNRNLKLLALVSLALSIILLVTLTFGYAVSRIQLIVFLEQFFLFLTFIVDSLQMLCTRLEVSFELFDKNDTRLFISISITSFILAIVGYFYEYFHSLSPDIIVLGVLLGCTFTITTSFLFFIGIGNQQRLRDIAIIRPNFLTSFSEFKQTHAGAYVEIRQVYILNYKLESAIEAMKREYFNLADYSIFLRNRLIYASPLFIFAIIRFLLTVDGQISSSSIYLEVVLGQLPYYAVMYYCIELNKSIESLEDELRLKTDLKIRIFNVDVRHTWLVSIILSIASLYFRIVTANQNI